MIKCLVIEDDDLMQGMLKEALIENGISVTLAETGDQGWTLFQEEIFDLVITDFKLPGMDGLTILEHIKSKSPEAMVILITGYGTIEGAVKAMKLGAFDYLTKPFLSEELIHLVQKALEFQNLRLENKRLKKELLNKYSVENIIGKSKPMQDVFRLMEVVAPSPTTVLIQGESGTGKERVAEAIHQLSDRKNKPLIKVSCAALPENLLESELFGHEKGAFTNAIKRKLGRFEMAHQGSLFLDDVDDMHPGIQVKLLRVLQERELVRVGGTETISVDVRLITATKTDLKLKIEDGSFREDLYYRLNVVPILLPPLKERVDDIPLLIQHFTDKFCARCGKNLTFSESAMTLLMNYHWPGNIRELENTIERLVTVSQKGNIDISDLPENFRNKPHWKPQSIKSAVAEAEAYHIQKVLKMTNGHKKQAAEILGITPKTLWVKLKELGLSEN
ncbi:sigma-54-dependent Fis family transcriptional regulator [candidate division KSB1 bacterium]|nr:sigma-54-dependent Fis family transcriptional regulator [candidate division KSB1 bacterium]